MTARHLSSLTAAALLLGLASPAFAEGAGRDAWTGGHAGASDAVRGAVLQGHAGNEGVYGASPMNKVLDEYGLGGIIPAYNGVPPQPARPGIDQILAQYGVVLPTVPAPEANHAPIPSVDSLGVPGLAGILGGTIAAGMRR